MKVSFIFVLFLSFFIHKDLYVSCLHYGDQVFLSNGKIFVGVDSKKRNLIKSPFIQENTICKIVNPKNIFDKGILRTGDSIAFIFGNKYLSAKRWPFCCMGLSNKLKNLECFKIYLNSEIKKDGFLIGEFDEIHIKSWTKKDRWLGFNGSKFFNQRKPFCWNLVVCDFENKMEQKDYEIRKHNVDMEIKKHDDYFFDKNVMEVPDEIDGVF